MGIVEHRRALHRIPELDRSLSKTVAYLTEALSGLGCRIFRPTPYDLCAFFDFGFADAIAFRADMDALPIQEATAAPYASCHSGAMHACGHDGHMAILLELAGRLRRQTLRHNVLLVFQSAEETTGGADGICQSGVLEQYRVQCIFGLHLWPGLDKGKVFCRAGAMMARSSEVTAEIFGKSSHIARPAEGADATEAAVLLYTAARSLERSLADRGQTAVLNFGLLESGTVRNALSAHARLAGSLRVFRDEDHAYLCAGLRRAAAEAEAKTDCRVALSVSTGYPPVWNDPALVSRLQALVPFELLPQPTMTTEDFSFYQRKVPGLFFFLGLGDAPALHSANFDFDETVLSKGADFFTAIAEVL